MHTETEETPAPEPLPNPEKEIQVSGHSRKKKRTLGERCASLSVEERIVNLLDEVADLYLRPFGKRSRSELLTQSMIHADETVLQMLRKKGMPATAESCMWVYASVKRADIQLLVIPCYHLDERV